MGKKILAALLGMLMIMTVPACVAAQLNSGDFLDIRTHWGKNAINEVIANGWMEGMGTDNQGYHIFEPQGTVTRAQASMVLFRMFHLDYGDKQFIKQPLASDYYRDVDNGAWYAEAVTMCAINTIFEDGEYFCPEQAITRLEMAKAIQNCFTAKKISIPMIMMLPIYDDIINLSPGDVNAIAFVTNTAIMRGDNSYFRPLDTLTRAELAQVLINTKAALKLHLGDEYSIGQSGSQPEAVKITTQVINEENEHMRTNLSIPVISGLTDRSLQTELNQGWRTDALAFAEGLSADLEAYIEGREDVGAPVFPYEAVSTYQVATLNEKFLSLYVDYYQYTGGAHGMTDRIAYNIDLNSGAPMTLASLFKSGYDYQGAINQFIQSEIATRPGDFFSGDMGFVGIADEQPYYLSDSKLVIYFGLYEIAPYAAGFPQFQIPLSNLNEGLNAPLI